MVCDIIILHPNGVIDHYLQVSKTTKNTSNALPFPGFARPRASLEFKALYLQYYIEIHWYTRIVVLNLFIGT